MDGAVLAHTYALAHTLGATGADIKANTGANVSTRACRKHLGLPYTHCSSPALSSQRWHRRSERAFVTLVQALFSCEVEALDENNSFSLLAMEEKGAGHLKMHCQPDPCMQPL